jgi:hypothetical protein
MVIPVVGDGNDSWYSNVDGTPCPQEQLTRITPIHVAANPRLRTDIAVVLLEEILTWPSK